MVIGPDTIRDASPNDAEEINALLAAAFGTCAEVDLVSELREDGDLYAEVVKEWRGEIGSYVALVKLHTPPNWVVLAFLAALPRFQNGALDPEGLAGRHWQFELRLAQEMALLGEINSAHRQLPDAVVAVGDPSFYSKAGFSAESARYLKSPFPSERTLVSAPGRGPLEGELLFPAKLIAFHQNSLLQAAL